MMVLQRRDVVVTHGQFGSGVDLIPEKRLVQRKGGKTAVSTLAC